MWPRVWTRCRRAAAKRRAAANICLISSIKGRPVYSSHFGRTDRFRLLSLPGSFVESTSGHAQRRYRWPRGDLYRIVDLYRDFHENRDTGAGSPCGGPRNRSSNVRDRSNASGKSPRLCRSRVIRGRARAVPFRFNSIRCRKPIRPTRRWRKSALKITPTSGNL